MSEYARYPEYKDSGVPWLGEIPSHWQVKKFNYVINQIGDTDHYMPESVEEGVPYLMTGDLKELASDIDLENCKKVSLNEFLKLSKKIKTQRDDLILARYATIGTVSYVDIDTDFLVSYACVTIKPNFHALKGIFLFHYFKSTTFLNGIKVITNINTQGNVGIDDLKKLKLPLPPIEEQAQIANFLDHELGKIDALIDKQQLLLDKLAEQRSAVITQAVTKGLNPNAEMKDSGVAWLGDVPIHWDTWKITHAIDLIGSGTTPKSDNSAFYDGETLWVTTSELRESIITDTIVNPVL